MGIYKSILRFKKKLSKLAQSRKIINFAFAFAFADQLIP